MGFLDKLFGPFGDFFSSKPTYSFHNSNELLRAAKGNKDAMKGYGGKTSNEAYANLLQLLQSQGKTDPRLMNQQMAGIQRDTQGAQQQMQGNLQGRGFQNSGVGAALQAALGQAGAGKQADVRAREAQAQQERRRQDLQLFQMLIGNPSIDWASMGIGAQQATRNSNIEVAKMKLKFLGGFGSMLSGA